MVNMQNEIRLPEDYTPVGEILLCSNTLIDVKIPILADNVPILLIGQGILPEIWLSARTDVRSKNWKYIVERSIKKSNMININMDETAKEVKIKFKNRLILNLRKESEDMVVVDLLDLRPIGLNIHGNKDILNIGNNELSKNSIIKVNTAFAIGP